MTKSVMMYAGDQYYGDQPICAVHNVKYYGEQSQWTDSRSPYMDPLQPFILDSQTSGYAFKPYQYFDTPTFLGGQIVYETDEWEIFKMVAILKDVIDMFVVVNKNDNAIVFTSLDYPEAEAYIYAQKIKEIL
ncbi:MAG: hypothetical protein WC877_01105 [Dehalococcoidales bacterium]|jgi:hypothetical protein